MIRLGNFLISTIPNNGIILDINGRIIFNGRFTIGNASAICVGKNGILNLGNNVRITAAGTISCFSSISIDSDTLISWKCEFYDTDFHVLSSMDNKRINAGFAPIYIGRNCWIAQGCKFFKGVNLTNYTTVGAYTKLFGTKITKEYCVIVNKSKAEMLKEGLYLNRNDNLVEYKK